MDLGSSGFVEAIGAFSEAAGQTVLIDSLYTACEHLASDKISFHRRYHTRALVLISDGVDNKSRHSAKELVECLQKTGVEVHSVVLYEPRLEKFVFAPNAMPS